jgi:Trk K+ transport system NAD-binding subunit
VLALRRNGELLVPHGNTRVDVGDQLTLVGSLDHVATARQMFGDVTADAHD